MKLYILILFTFMSHNLFAKNNSLLTLSSVEDVAVFLDSPGQFLSVHAPTMYLEHNSKVLSYIDLKIKKYFKGAEHASEGLSGRILTKIIVDFNSFGVDKDVISKGHTFYVNFVYSKIENKSTEFNSTQILAISSVKVFNKEKNIFEEIVLMNPNACFRYKKHHPFSC